MLESIPQTHILIFLAGKEPELIIGEGYQLFWATFTSSFLTAAFALAKFLKTGKVLIYKSQSEPFFEIWASFGPVGNSKILFN